MRIAWIFIAAFAALFLSFWGIFVLPLFFEAPHAVTLPGTYGLMAHFTTSQYTLAEVAGTLGYLVPPLVFIGVGIYVYFRMLADLPRLAALTAKNVEARRLRDSGSAGDGTPDRAR